MRIALFTVSRAGTEAAVKIHRVLREGMGYEGPDISVYIKYTDCDVNVFRDKGINANILGKEDDISDCVRHAFEEAGALIFICAAGIAVRLTAPFIVHKAKDPAVIVFDEKLRYCIPVLSGHLGGANELALKLASKTGAEAVITTASDINGMTAVDMFAKDNGLAIADLEKAKEYTAALLSGETLNVVNEAGDVTGDMILPGGYLPSDEHKGYGKRYIIRVAYKENDDAPDDALILIPRCLKLGIGCRMGTPAERIEEAVSKCLEKHGLLIDAIEEVCSIDIKKDEEGILSFCKDKGIGYTTYTADELNTLKGDFSRSDFVKEHAGVDNVCERSAMMKGSRLLVSKEKYDGITLAVAVVPRSGAAQAD